MCKLSSLKPMCSYLLLILSGILTASFSIAQENHFVPALTVAGVGEVEAAPDIAEIEAGVANESKVAADALNANNVAMQALFENLASFNIESTDIQTTAFNVFPVYSRGQGERRINAYRVENRIRVKVRDLDRFGEILDSLIGKGANVVHSINFAFADAKILQDQARVAAVENAREKARLYAKAAGVTLGKVIALQEENLSGFAPTPPMARTMRAEAASVPIAAGQGSLSVRVTVSFEIN